MSGFNGYAAGSKIYNGGSSQPTLGPVDNAGYRERDLKYATKKRNNAIKRRLMARQKKNYMSSDNLSAPTPGTV
jgi:hypothetical protein